MLKSSECGAGVLTGNETVLYVEQENDPEDKCLGKQGLLGNRDWLNTAYLSVSKNRKRTKLFSPCLVAVLRKQSRPL